jgi:outer membrane protein, heavy metal efflux system
LFFRSIKLILAISVCLSVCPAQAKDAQLFTLDQAIETAIQNNSQFKAAQARLGVSEAEVITAGARINPSILSDNGIAEKTYRLGLQQTFELGGKRRKRIHVAQAQQGVVLAEINTALLDLRSNVRRVYAQLFQAQERQRNAQDLLKTTEQLLDVARKREQAGDVSNLDVLQAEVVTVSAHNDIQTVNAQVLQARNQLNSLLNQPLGTGLILAPPTTLPQTVSAPSSGTQLLQGSVSYAVADLDTLIQTALSNRPEVKQNLGRIELTQKQLVLAQANRTPNLSLAAGPDFVTGDDTSFNAFIIGNLELPILNRQQGPIQEAIARQAQLAQEQAALKNRITLEVTNAYTAFVSNQDRVMRYETELLPKAKTVMDKSRRSFEVGKSPILLPLNAQQAYINTQLGYLQAVTYFQNAISDLERAVGAGL